MAKDSLRLDSSREGLKASGRSRRKAVAGPAEAEKASMRFRRNDILPSLRIEPCPVDALKLHVRKLRKNQRVHVREIANAISTPQHRLTQVSRCGDQAFRRQSANLTTALFRSLRHFDLLFVDEI